MKKIIALFILSFLSTGLAAPVYATLIDRGSGFIYDSDLNITWLQEPNNTPMNWNGASSWAAGLSYNGISGWRLPVTLGTNEMLHLFESELGNTAGFHDVNGVFVSGLKNKGPFSSLLDDGFYWSGSELESAQDFAAYIFSFGYGKDFYNFKTWPYYYALAVHDGDVSAPVPEPATMLLFGTGIAGLVVSRLRRKK